MVRWIIQKNLLAEKDMERLGTACSTLGIPCEWVTVIPFSESYPEHTIDNYYTNIYYGSTTFIWNVFDQLTMRGVFYDPISFSMENYMNRWGRQNMLSDKADFMTFKEFVDGNWNPDIEWFIRPDADDKAFAGTILRYGDIQRWYDNLLVDDIVGLKPETKIMVSPPYAIKKEWRNLVVDGRVVTSSRYRENHHLSKSGEDIPEDMIAFVEDMCKLYTPNPIFVMDVALTNDGYSIIECGCANSVGFYEMDVRKFVEAISTYVSDDVTVSEK